MTDGGGFGVAAGAMALITGRPRQQAGDHEYIGSVPPETDRRFERLHQIPFVFQIPITAGAGVYQMNDFLMPKAGYMWSVRNLTASGYSAGSVVAYKGGVIVGGAYIGTGQPMPFAAAGAQTFGRGELLLDQGDALVFTATGITLSTGYAGVQINGSADCFERWMLPRYLE